MRRIILGLAWLIAGFATVAGAASSARTPAIEFRVAPPQTDRSFQPVVQAETDAPSGTCVVRTEPIAFFAAPAPAGLVAGVRFEEPSGNRALDALEEGILVVTLENSGRGDAYDVAIRASLETQSTGLEFSSQTAIGTVTAGSQREVRLPLRATREVGDQSVKLRLEFPEASGFDADPVTVAFDTRSYAPPRLVIADFGIDDASGNGQVEPGEFVEVTVRVQNSGEGDAVGVTAQVELGPNIFHGAGSSPQHEVGNLQPGQHADFNFSFYTNKRISAGQHLPIKIRLHEDRGRYEMLDDLRLVANVPQRRSREVVVEAIARQETLSEAPSALSVDVDRQVPEGKTINPNAVAVVIGNRHYRRSNVPAVEFADRDAAMVQKYLVKTLGYDPRNILSVSDATLSDFNQLFGTRRNPQGRLHDYIRPGESDIFVYYTGHGAPDPADQSAYFVPSDADPDYIGSSGYSLDLFWENLAKIPARQVTVILDTCFSGNSEKGLLLTNVSPALLKVKSEVAGPSGAVVMTSAATDQVSNWYPEMKHSLFTYWWLKGVGGAADSNQDKSITVSELDQYLDEHVPYWAQRLSHRKQTPVVRGDPGQIVVQLK